MHIKNFMKNINFFFYQSASASRAIPLITDSFENNDFNLISSPINQFDMHENFTSDGKTILGGVIIKGIIGKKWNNKTPIKEKEKGKPTTKKRRKEGSKFRKNK